MLKTYQVDLHIHTVLSPCGDLEMGAPEVIKTAVTNGLDIIAISDHNTCDNCLAFINASNNRITVIPAIEIQSSEDIHLLTLYPDVATALKCKEWYWSSMLNIKNDVDSFGYQIVIDSENNIIRHEEKFLIQGVGHEIDEIIKKVHQLGGLAILAHIDRPSFSYPAVLGKIPDNYPVDALELSNNVTKEKALEFKKKYSKHTIIRSSDSHCLKTLTRNHATEMVLKEPSFEEIKQALHNENGRHVIFPWADKTAK